MTKLFLIDDIYEEHIKSDCCEWSIYKETTICSKCNEYCQIIFPQ